ncbi:MAG TPA: POTRA domain-containing protein, partial [Vicinamibacterales bacterium]
MRRTTFAGASFLLAANLLSGVAAAQDAPPPQARPVVRDVKLAGAKEFSRNVILRAGHIVVGQPLPDGPDKIAQDIEQRYRDEGYTFATARASFDEASGALTLTVDEGVIDVVEFEGVAQRVASAFVDEFALRAGDVFNRARATQALN